MEVKKALKGKYQVGGKIVEVIDFEDDDVENLELLKRHFGLRSH